ncbi:unnamed protein product [Calypogeia fissa]
MVVCCRLLFVCLLFRIVKSLGFPHCLKVAAKIDAVNMEYYETELKPLIDGVQIEYIGEIDFDGKNALLRDAKALLRWLNWDEPFGLVVAEANGCGTPVVGGALCSRSSRMV